MVFKDPSLAAKTWAPVFGQMGWVWWSPKEKQWCSPTESEILEELQRLARDLLNDPDASIKVESGRLAVSYSPGTKEIIYQLDSSSETELSKHAQTQNNRSCQ